MGIVCPDCDRRKPRMCARHGGTAGKIQPEPAEEEVIPTAGVGEVEATEEAEEEAGPVAVSEEPQ
jgi:hypothetical protein